MTERRSVLKMLLGAGIATAAGCASTDESTEAGTGTRPTRQGADRMNESNPSIATAGVGRVTRLGFPWQTSDPFLFCVHHDDRYPEGNEQMGPAASLEGRTLGSDFGYKDGWSMYHGEVVPGFPRHPHRGFETVTVVRNGLLDHSDSLGARARYGQGDVQWLTTGSGVLHAEMFPLLDPERPNPVELFQIWLNLPAEDKMVAPHFTMLWADGIPSVEHRDEAGRVTRLTFMAGPHGELAPPAPPPHSWASRADSHVAIWTVKLEAGARFSLPAVPAGVDRSLYFFEGDRIRIAGSDIAADHRVEIDGTGPILLENTGAQAELLLLQGRPIAEPVAQHGPFVMNSRQELVQAYEDYQRTQFGGWPWDRDDPVHGRDPQRFAQHADGRTERPA